MSMDELIAMLRKKAEELDVSEAGFLAVQVNLKDMDPGVLYIEVKNHKITIEPYEYNDRNCAITMKQKNFIKLVEGNLDPILAFTLGKLKVDGDIGKALEFGNLLKKSRK